MKSPLKFQNVFNVFDLKLTELSFIFLIIEIARDCREQRELEVELESIKSLTFILNSPLFKGGRFYFENRGFTLIDVKDGEIEKVSTISNKEHVQGGCMVPVNLLAENKVNALIVGGIGMRPLMGFRQAGIDVYHDAVRPEIRPVVEDLIAGKLSQIEDNQVCGGGGR